MSLSDKWSWLDDALCFNDYATFDSEDPNDWPNEQEICRACPIRILCLEDALSVPDTHFVRGGVTPTGLKQAAGVNSDGDPSKSKRPLFCPNCRSFNITRQNRALQDGRTVVVCGDCQLTWPTYRTVLKQQVHTKKT